MSVSRAGESSTITVAVPSAASLNERFLAGIGAGSSAAPGSIRSGWLSRPHPLWEGRSTDSGSRSRWCSRGTGGVRSSTTCTCSCSGDRQPPRRSPTGSDVSVGRPLARSEQRPSPLPTRCGEAGGSTDTGWIDLLFRCGPGRLLLNPRRSASGLGSSGSDSHAPSLRTCCSPRPRAAATRPTATRSALPGDAYATGDEAALGEIVVGVPVFELAYPAWLLASDSSYERFRSRGWGLTMGEISDPGCRRARGGGRRQAEGPGRGPPVQRPIWGCRRRRWSAGRSRWSSSRWRCCCWWFRRSGRSPRSRPPCGVHRAARDRRPVGVCRVVPVFLGAGTYRPVSFVEIARNLMLIGLAIVAVAADLPFDPISPRGSR